ncbi:hypothetical protein PAPYR_9465 [Paratrimastix pyriformis]|uniref:Uncharacterized protein n=1 Tax=Paratrimastix pyriformis TaxID=342808 RepID=A0ABQ8UDX4_9EUKA|nr:hypothetical protein PAPYR_9465 [Paratrimastix pyriformis]
MHPGHQIQPKVSFRTPAPRLISLPCRATPPRAHHHPTSMWMPPERSVPGALCSHGSSVDGQPNTNPKTGGVSVPGWRRARGMLARSRSCRHVESRPSPPPFLQPSNPPTPHPSIPPSLKREAGEAEARAHGLEVRLGEAEQREAAALARVAERGLQEAHSPAGTSAPAMAPTRACGEGQPARRSLPVLPPELLRAIVEASPCPLQTYMQLVSLSHAIRGGLRGTLRELSFADPPEPSLAGITPTITPDALAALVGPCTALRTLSLPEGVACADPGWADEAFGGHSQLAVLRQVPCSLPEPAIERILGHLPGLAELTVHPQLHMSTRLLEVLARSCPGLQVLRCTFQSYAYHLPDFAALAPLSGSLRVLDIGGLRDSEDGLAAFVGSLSALTSLRIACCPSAALEPVASHLVCLEGLDVGAGDDLPGPWLCHLEALSLRLSGCPAVPLARLLAANQATLSRLGLTIRFGLAALRHGAADLPPLLASSLGGLPRLTHLALAVEASPDCPLAALVPPELVDRLTDLRLLRLSLDVQQRGPTPWLTLDCPALVTLDLNGPLAALRCPRLRTLRAQATPGLAVAAPMPDLEEVVFRGPHMVDDPTWLLAGSSPRLRALTRVRLTRPDLLARLGACGWLVRLKELRLDAGRLPSPLVLRLPGQLEQLDLRVEGHPEPPALPDLQLQVAAPGLRDFDLIIADSTIPGSTIPGSTIPGSTIPGSTIHDSTIPGSAIHDSTIPGSTIAGSDCPPPPSVQVRLHCPRLVRLGLQSPAATVLSLQLDDDGLGDGAELAPMPLRMLSVAGGLDGASLLGLLTRHGAQLRVFSARGLRAAASAEVWLQLMRALWLPRLAGLMLDLSEAPSAGLWLACPRLRTLQLHGLPDGARVVLACPLLERLGGIRDPAQVELVLPAPQARLVSYYQ